MGKKQSLLIIILLLVFVLACQSISGSDGNSPIHEDEFSVLPTQTAFVSTPTLNIEPTIDSTIVSEKDRMTLVFVPAGEFTMGSDSGYPREQPEHRVYLDAFWIDQTEVTNAMYKGCVEDGSCTPPSSTNSYTNENYYGNPQFDDYPVIFINWHQSTAYCEWAGRRLPTEAEWEKAARGTDSRTYPWGNQFDGTKANFCDRNCGSERADAAFDDGYSDVAPVGSYPAGSSIYGLLDMAGNVHEWVNDWFDENYYSSSPSSNPLGPASGEGKVLRSGSWGSIDYGLNTAHRFGDIPTNANFDFGFRCASSE